MKQNTIHSPVGGIRLLTLALLTLLPGLPLRGQTVGETRVAAGVGYRADADIDGKNGDFNETRFSLVGSTALQVNDRTRLDPILSYRFSAYDFSGRGAWDDVHQVRATLLGHYAWDEAWTLLAGPSIGVAAESGADWADALLFGGAAGVSYKLDDTFTIGAGFTITTEIEDSATIRPLVILNWEINPRWTVEGGYLEVAGAGGPGGEVSYFIDDQWTAAAGIQFQEKRFRLSDDGRNRDGVGEDSSFPVYAKVTWQPCANAAFELVGGIAIAGELQVENRRGHKIFEEDYDAAPLVGLRAILTF